MRFLALLAIAAACSKSADPKPDDNKPATTGSDTPLASAADAATFCTRAYFKMMDCFKDDEFWQVFATVYFANTNLTSDETERQHWIGVMKEDLLKLYNEHGFEENCKISLEHNKAPTPASIQKVSDAAQKSCAAFGSAFGFMVFNEGAFHQPK